MKPLTPEFKKEYKRLLRQLSERQIAVSQGKKPDKYYQNKRREFIEFIDKAIADGFKMPGPKSMIWKIYHDIWD